MSETPNSAMVAVAWLASIDGLAPAATSRPADAASWATTGFLVVSAVGSAGDRDLPGQRKPILTVDAWAATPGSSKPPRAMSAGILERVRAAIVLHGDAPRIVTPRSGSVAYAPALVTDVWLETAEGREMPDPDATYAHHALDIGLSWVRVGP